MAFHFAGLFRPDVFETLRELRPGFVRTPGGNYLEGFGPRTRWDWKKTLGPAAARPGHYNAAWRYWVTDGLGLYELLTLCELLGAPCQMSVYSGYSMGAPYVPLNESGVFADEACDLLDFANAAEGSSRWAATRASMGHAAPFGLHRLEVMDCHLIALDCTRALMGHVAPFGPHRLEVMDCHLIAFGLHCFEVGNEERLMASGCSWSLLVASGCF